jgi:hypothetical protein
MTTALFQPAVALDLSQLTCAQQRSEALDGVQRGDRCADAAMQARPEQERVDDRARRIELFGVRDRCLVHHR